MEIRLDLNPGQFWVSISVKTLYNMTKKSVILIICSSLGLQKDLDEMKIKCGDSYKVAKDNIDGESAQT